MTILPKTLIGILLVLTVCIVASGQGTPAASVGGGAVTGDIAAGKTDGKAAAANAAGTAKPARNGHAIVLPPEKARAVVVPRFETPPVIDGKIDDDPWKHAAVFQDFYQFNPGDNTPPTERTVVLMGYDARNLYLAFHCYDDPQKIRATIAKRDQIFGEDNVRVMLDTFNDRRRAYMLGFNPYGIQADGIYTEGQGTDFSLDIVMESKGSITSDGYVVEVAIPFKSLRYEAGPGKEWGIHLWRNIGRMDDEMDSWMPISRDKASRLEQEGHITGLDNLATERMLEIIPTLTLSETGRRAPAYPLSVTANNPAIVDNGRFVNSPLTVDPGISVKLGITPNVTLDFTINPDFAQIEADRPVLTANQRFPIFYAEKRPFFLEGADMFQTPIQAVHTRAIVDPDYAAKLTGKVGRNSFGLLVASDNAPGNYSEEERNDPQTRAEIEPFLDKNATIGVARYKRDVGRESSIGVIATSYNFVQNHNQLAGIDGRFKLDDKTVFSFQTLGTLSRQNFYNPVEDQTDYRNGNGLAYNLMLDHTARHFGYTIFGAGQTRDYRANVGFVQRTNTNDTAAYFRISNDPRTNAKFVSWRIFGGNDIAYDFQGRSQNISQNVNVNLQFTRQTYVRVGYGQFYERLVEEEFGPKRTADHPGAFAGGPERSASGRSVWMNAETNPTKRFNAYAFVGRRFNLFDYDFGNGPRYPRVSPAALLDPNAPLDPGMADSLDIESGVEVKPVNELNMSVSYSRYQYRRNDTGRIVFIDHIGSFRTTYQFTRFVFARIRVDYDSLASRIQGQYLFGWTPNPGTSFYVGYDDDMNVNGFNPFSGLPEPGLKRNSRTFFIKMSYLIRRSL